MQENGEEYKIVKVKDELDFLEKIKEYETLHKATGRKYKVLFKASFKFKLKTLVFDIKELFYDFIELFKR